MKAPKYRSIGLFATVLAFYLISPLLNRGVHFEASISVVFSFVIGLFGYLLRPSRVWLIGVTSFSALALLFFIVRSILPGSVVIGFLYQLALLGILILTLWHCLRYALYARDPRPFDRVIAGVSGYFILGLIWASIYSSILGFHPEAIQQGEQAIGPANSTVFYYSLITLTTQGYGEIVPANPYVRILAGMEGAFGSIYLAVLIAVLVSEVRREREIAK
ncbi:MAG: potassium channel family protein [Verrucomicrobiota bacterium]